MRLVPLLLAALLALPCAAQGLTWERVGAEMTQTEGPPLVLSDGAFLMGGSAFPASGGIMNGLLRLAAPHRPEQSWERAYPYDFDQDIDPVVSFGPDTLFTYLDTDVARSVNGGATFERLPAPAACEDSRMVEVPAGLPHAGRLLCGNRTGQDGAGFVTFSDDRGDSWHEAFGPAGTQDPAAEHLEVVGAGPRAGRVVAAGGWGLATSDDGGATWQPTAVWQYFRYFAFGFATLAGAAPGGGDRLIASVADPVDGVANGLFVSDDGGDSWARIYSFGGNDTEVDFVDLGGGAALAVLGRGNVLRTEDGGASWAEVGAAPFSFASGDGNGRAGWAWRGPDGRLYVGGNSLGPPRPGQTPESYTWRTTEPLAVAGEAAPSAGEAIGVAVSPNPASGQVTVGVALPSPSASVRVEVFDSVGRRVASLFEGTARGDLALSVDTSRFAVGTYRVVVTAEGAHASRAFTVAR